MNRLFGPDDDSVSRIHAQLKHLVAIGLPAVFGSGQQLTQEQISQLLESTFWASLRADEGRATRTCVAVSPAMRFPDALAFHTPVVYGEGPIAKLAPAVPPGGCLLVSISDGRPEIWGIGRTRPISTVDGFAIELSEPGVIRVNVGPFQPFIVLNGRSNPVLAGSRIDLAHFLKSALRKTFPENDILQTQAVWRECLVLTFLAKTIVEHGHGGMLLIVPNESGPWSASIDPFAYKLVAPDTRIRDGIRRELTEMAAQGEMLQRVSQPDVPADLRDQILGAVAPRPWYDERDVLAISSFAGVDGAIVIASDLSVLGFGATIAVPQDGALRVCTFRPEPGSQEAIAVPLETLGGTRHQSAARFVGANKDSVAVVLSQDRHMSVMRWDEQISAVAVLRNTEWLI